MKKYSQETWVGLFMTFGLICVTYLSFQLGHVSLFKTDTYPLTAQFLRVSSLREGNPVTMMGIDIGQITGLDIDQEHQVALVHFRIRKKINIYRDAIASIKTRGLIGEEYMEIDPGGAGELLKPGDTIIDTEPPFDLIETISKYAFGSVENQKNFP
jgi:phospholipid/cholesterol/gamma-HCH transport system substrate-binding protein